MLHFFKLLIPYSNSRPALTVVPISEIRKVAMLLLLVAGNYEHKVRDALMTWLFILHKHLSVDSTVTRCGTCLHNDNSIISLAYI
jgi:hypothetical protein